MKFRKPHLLATLLTAVCLQITLSCLAATEPALTSRENLAIRDPFVLPIPETKTYYLYATHQDPETKRFGVQFCTRPTILTRRGPSFSKSKSLMMSRGSSQRQNDLFCENWRSRDQS
jgi:hypothetical protein